MERSPKHPLEITHTYPCCKEPRDGACHVCHVTKSHLDTPSSLKVHFQIEFWLFIQCKKTKKITKTKRQMVYLSKTTRTVFLVCSKNWLEMLLPRLTSQSRRPPLRSQQSSDSEPALLQRTTSPPTQFQHRVVYHKINAA